MHNKIGSIVAIAVAVVVFLAGAQLVQWMKVKTTLSDTLAPQNAHMFSDSQALEGALWDSLLFVPEEAELMLELYHYKQMVAKDRLGGATLPAYGGVQTIGRQVEISALVAQVTWTQDFFGYAPRTVVVRRAVLVDANKIGFGYRAVPRDWDIYEDPGLLLRDARL